jgi:hypothetical protein
MGYGGNLIWTAVFRAIARREKRPVAPVHLPGPSDLLQGRLYDGAKSLASDEIYRANPILVFPAARHKGPIARLADTAFFHALTLLRLRESFERWVLARATIANATASEYLVHVDMRIHSYAAAQDQRRTVWKDAPRAATAMLDHLGGGDAAPTCEMFFDADERASAAEMLKTAGVSGSFVAFEPDTNPVFFGDLRAWPFENWQAALARLRELRPDLQLLQLGTGSGPAIPGAIDMRGRTSFRQAALILGEAKLFVGTEGGLMHAAQAVGARSLVLWGGLTLPEFIGYPGSQRTLCKYVACAPCGNNGWCDNGRICMRGISVDEVVVAMLEELDAR